MLKWLKNTFSKSQADSRPVQLTQGADDKSGLNIADPAPPQATVAGSGAQEHLASTVARDPVAVAYEKLQLNPAEHLSLSQLADQLYDRSLFVEAEMLYRLILQEQPASLDTWINLGLSLDGQTRFEEALSCYAKVISHDAQHTIAHFNLGVSLSSLGRVQEAEQAYLRALEINPQFTHAHFNLGILFQQQNHLEDAIRHYQELLKIDPNHYYAHCNLSTIYTLQGRLDEAETCLQRAITVRPDLSNADFLLVHIYQQQSRQSDIEIALKNLWQRQPDNHAARDALLNLYTQLGRFADAAVIYRQMLAASPTDSIAHYNLGVMLKEQNLVQEAQNCFQKAVQLKPDFTESYANLGLTFQDQGKFREAEASYRRSLECNLKYTHALTNLAHLLHANGRNAEAEENYRKAIECEPNNPEHLCNLGKNLFAQQRYSESESCFQQALALDPKFVDALHEYGKLLMFVNRLEAARNCFENAIRMKPDNAIAYNLLGDLLSTQGKAPEAITLYSRALEYKPGFSIAYSGMLFNLNYHPDLSAEEIYTAYQEYERRFIATYYQEQRPHTNSKISDRRLKIGYVSPDLRRHPMQHFLEPLLAHHDKRQFEIFAYPELLTEDAVSARYRNYVDHWVPTKALSNEALSEKIRADGIDILVDLAGHTGDNRLQVFARKPAPVSLSWLGYGYTTGMSAVDYFLTDATCAPEGSDAIFAEQVWRVDTPVFAYRPADGMGVMNTLPALNNGYVTLGTLSRAVRINHKVIRTWAKILQRLENAKLVIDSANFRDAAIRASFEDKFAALGIERSRLLIGAHSPPWDVLRGLDIGLDCFPHNSGTTLFETLYMGVPFVTLADRPSVGRLGSSILQGLGRAEWIATDEDDYVNKVVSLASDLDNLNTIRLTQRTQMQNSPLMDEVALTRKIEAAYRSMWQRWCSK